MAGLCEGDQVGGFGGLGHLSGHLPVKRVVPRGEMQILQEPQAAIGLAVFGR